MKKSLVAFVTFLAIVLCASAQEGRPVVIKTPQKGARVFIDGKEVGVSPHRCYISFDSHWIYAIQDGQTSETFRLKVERGKGMLPEIVLVFHDYVDLALPSGTLWATCNVGAKMPEEHGDYFAWSETQPVTETTSETYEYKSEMHTKDDPAFFNWGSDWCMPTLEQLQELIAPKFTTTTFTSQNGVKGLEITSRKNGHTLFLPASGFSFDGKLEDTNDVGYYWSSTPGNTYLNTAFQLYFMDSDTFTNSCDRFYGRSVRAVRMK